MKVKALRVFNDLKGKKIRSIGEEFKVSNERYEEISAADVENPFVEIVDASDSNDDNKQSEFPKHVGGGYYELSNGEKVKGKDEANEAENQLKA